MSELYIALYRKYRPQSFGDVVGQEHIVSLLQASIAQKKISHAYLFCGGRGTGKTTVARIFARDIGCNPEDIIEIDAASNRGIDEIRELREAVRTAPFSSPYKVYIIDEAHMLTKEAANALLKTLEEPPSHVIFILATTDEDKLPTTIVSRCQKIIFKQPDISVLASRLLFVAEQEGKKLEQKTAELVATHGKGSYRDALGVLEQVLTTSGAIVSHEDVSSLLGVVKYDGLCQVLEALGKKDTLAMVDALDAVLATSTPVATYDSLILLIREGLLSRISKDTVENTTAVLAKTYPYLISSKTILTLLEKRHLLEVSPSHARTALLAILFTLSEVA